MGDVTAEPTKSRRQNKGFACEECRSRKLKCDMSQPQCSTCRNLGVPCITNTARRPRGPRKGHVNILRSRIASLERQLYENSEGQPSRRESSTSTQHVLEVDQSERVNIGKIEKASVAHSQDSTDDFLLDPQSIGLLKWPSVIPSLELDSEWCKHIEPFPECTYQSPALTPASNIPTSVSSACPIDASISPLELGSQAMTTPIQLPVQLSALERADLDDLFFDRAYPFAPIIHQQRYYLRAANEPDAREPLTALQYAMRTLAASMGSQFQGVLPLLYTHTCCLLDVWEQHMPNEALPIEVVQARLLLVLYEILKSNPSKGWISAGRCFHLVHLLKLDQIDNPNTWQTSSLSWVEIEERRRTFWTAYALDRYANLVNGLPLAINDQMILTRLPAPETAFRHQQAVTTEYLAPAMARKADQQVSPYAKSIVMLTILARCLSHRNQCNVERIMDPTSQECIVRHRALDIILSQESQTTLSSPAADFSSSDPTSIFVDMLAQVAVLVLFTALNSVPEAAEMYQDMYGSYETKAAIATERVLSQAQKLSQIGPFKARLVS
ncbi:fungal-specific transcription factor domain-containing protein [Aspergillus pseudonomiae]|uniref:Fungal-specific transcription factor domain-containing protein n=1 Tax=Aspergillus pseudonomiae TaxID=1506151 RepID=A0A5N7DKF7_9EURO|nr:fungal-specific transcription factor domain-containing protein [Aspergillus pseudonomiae]KAE8406920.1 fungal-specific transcription factor domain-containing protein [Aspergillus pseudonomiae]